MKRGKQVHIKKSITLAKELANLKNAVNCLNKFVFQFSASSWEMAFQEFMSSNAKRLSGLKIDWYSSLTQEVEFEMSIVPNVVPYCGLVVRFFQFIH